VARPATTVATITQLLARSGREPFDKRETLRRLIRSAEGMKNAIVFCNRKRDVATLHRSLLRHGFSVQALHGDMDQSARTAALEQFRKGEVTLLVASDVAARGLDIPDVSHVYNFDVPVHPDDYVHRIGRTGRAGRSGQAITIVAGSNDAKAVAAIEKLTGQTIPYMDKAPDKTPDNAPANVPAKTAERPRHERANGERAAQSARPQQSKREPNRHRNEQQRHQQRPAPVARIDEARSRRAQPPVRNDDGDASHLPAFLLRPVTVKA
jgi:superfamily II DNA/RNA helicase